MSVNTLILLTILSLVLAGVSLIVCVVLTLQYRAFAAALAVLLKDAVDALVNALVSSEAEPSENEKR